MVPLHRQITRTNTLDMTRIVVLGTGTDIGKTHASIAITAALADSGIPTGALKPIESGVSLHATTDASSLAAVSSIPIKPQPYAFPDPVSPHLAARRTAVTIDFDRITRWIDSHLARVVLVETAGAMLSPLNRDRTNLDLARTLKPDVLLLVAPDRLGALHDVSAAFHALRTLAPELPRPTLLLQPPASPDSSTGTNADEIAWLGIAPKPHVFPRAKPTDRTTREAARALLAEWRLLHA
jgi:dethiobiotin synthetase